ncbi:Putative auto-transporter adhesin, head GIN domain [Zobellia uliginosa]|uniref:Auto-transporter adhesin, head GIN domain n=1 Tax=Zobellia uliginosa TaxID=143224 RepID=A0ABY1KV45_9FLAO|nr:DUF2807 domain-containing protein [Zobellia uliginosa]SIS82348.1 Putative auto-transporter adhesin, head GIN domain [Zobellia uliginosa]
MKDLVFLFVVLFVCQGFSQRKPKIKGNKSVIEVYQGLPPFHAIELRDGLEIKLHDATEEGVSIVADDNLIDVLRFRVIDSVLQISSFYNITRKKKLEITVDYIYLEGITMYDGKIDMDGAINSKDLYVDMHESAKLNLNADAEILNINMEGNSSGDFNIAGREMNLVLKDRVDVEIYANTHLNNIKMYKNASAILEGTAIEVYANLLENSKLKGEKLEAESIYLTIEESASAEVRPTRNIQLSSSGNAKTYLFGEGKVEIIDFLDTSELHKEK